MAPGELPAEPLLAAGQSQSGLQEVRRVDPALQGFQAVAADRPPDHDAPSRRASSRDPFHVRGRPRAFRVLPDPQGNAAALMGASSVVGAQANLDMLCPFAAQNAAHDNSQGQM